MKHELAFAGCIFMATVAMSPAPVLAQTHVQDISTALQQSLEASAPVRVYFDFDKSDISEEASKILLKQADWLKQHSDAKVDLAGHTDAVGPDSYNDGLAMRRAKAVEAFLFTQGVKPEQMRSVVSRGESELAVSTTKRERLNRRVTTNVTGLVEIVVAAAPPRAPSPRLQYPTPTKRIYLEAPLTLCENRSRTVLLDTRDLISLRSQLNTRLQTANSAYQNPKIQASEGNQFSLSAYTKAQCGIAIGYTKKKIIDKRSISNCECSADMISANMLATTSP